MQYNWSSGIIELGSHPSQINNGNTDAVMRNFSKEMI